MDKRTQVQHLREPPEEKSRGQGLRSFLGKAAIRAVEDTENKRRFILSFSSEEPYRRWFGLEVLDHNTGAVDLTRLNEVGVLLFNHDTFNVMGKVLRAWVEDRRGYAEIEFDTDEEAEVIFQKVSSGTLKTTSVRYTVDVFEEVTAGKTSADGFMGPCSIARKWTPLEISIVSVPADASVGVGRDYDEGSEDTENMDTFERQITANKNYL